MSLGLIRPPLADSMMLTLTSHYTATNAKHHRYAATNLPTAPDARRPRGVLRAARIGAAGRPEKSARRAPGDGVRRPGWAPGDGVRRAGWAPRRAGWAPRRAGWAAASGGLGGRTRVKRDRLRYDGNGAGHELGPGWPRHEWSGCPPGRCLVRDLGKDHDGRDWVSGIGSGLAGHVRLGGNLEHRNPSASDIHPRNRTPVGNVSLGTDDAIQGHRTGPGAIPRNKEGKDGC